LVPGVVLSETVGEPRRVTFSFPSSREVETLRDESSSQIRGVIVRRQQVVEGAIELRIEPRGLRVDEPAQSSSDPQSAMHNPQLFKITARILNLTPLED